jgi:hypothetical protein
MQLKYYNRKINEAIAKALGYRPWQFGDPWVKGLKLMDTRFNNYVRKVRRDAPANVVYIKLDIAETPTQKVDELKANYIPCSHWVSPDNEIKAKPPNFVADLNAMRIAEEFLTADEVREYVNILPLRGDQSYANTAQSRAICWLRAKKIEYCYD